MLQSMMFKLHFNAGDTFSSFCLACLVNEGLAALAFTGVEVNMVLFSKSVLRQSNADAANMFSRWMGTLNICALIGAFLSDSYMGRYVTCVVFQTIMVVVSKLHKILTKSLA